MKDSRQLRDEKVSPREENLEKKTEVKDGKSLPEAKAGGRAENPLDSDLIKESSPAESRSATPEGGELLGRKGARGATFGFADMWGNYMTACLLLNLRNCSAYGYLLQKNLEKFGLPKIDYGTLYRTLRHLEDKGFVTSGWDTTSQPGRPPRRIYSLTTAGEAFLESWAGALQQYRRNLDFFFGFYGGAVQPDIVEEDLAAATMAAAEAAEANERAAAQRTKAASKATPQMTEEVAEESDKPARETTKGRRTKTR